MPLYILFALAVIQGATEFLPVSSSAHLALFPWLTGAAAQPLVIDIAVHLGTLFAVLLYYRSDTGLMLRGVADLSRGRYRTNGARLIGLLTLATIPVVIAGMILHVTDMTSALRDPRVIGWAMLLFALPLYLSDRLGRSDRQVENWSLRHSIMMGLAQAFALIPGASRSGVTMTAGRWLGYGRVEAARLSMLMSIPTIIASATLLGLDAADTDPAMLPSAGIAMLLSLVVAYLSIGFMLGLLKRLSLAPFVVYRICLGAALLLLV